MRSPAWRWLFWLMLVAALTKIILWVIVGKIIWFAVAGWFFWLMVTFWVIFMIGFALYLYRGWEIGRKLIWYFIIMVLFGLALGWSTHAVHLVNQTDFTTNQ